MKASVIGVYFIPSEPMELLLRPGDRILVNLWERPERGEVIVFDGAGSYTEAAGTPTTRLGSGPIQVALGVDRAPSSSSGPSVFQVTPSGIPGEHHPVLRPDRAAVVNGVPLVEPYAFSGDAPARTGVHGDRPGWAILGHGGPS